MVFSDLEDTSGVTESKNRMDSDVRSEDQDLRNGIVHFFIEDIYIAPSI